MAHPISKPTKNFLFDTEEDAKWFISGLRYQFYGKNNVENDFKEHCFRDIVFEGDDELEDDDFDGYAQAYFVTTPECDFRLVYIEPENKPIKKRLFATEERAKDFLKFLSDKYGDCLFVEEIGKTKDVTGNSDHDETVDISGYTAAYSVMTTDDHYYLGYVHKETNN